MKFTSRTMLASIILSLGFFLTTAVQSAPATSILKNGDFEESIPFVKNKKPNTQGKFWVSQSKDVPAAWVLHQQNVGTIELRHDNPASGKNYIRVSGKYAYLFQFGLPRFQTEGINWHISAKVRGKGEIILRLYDHKKGYLGDQKVKSFNSPDKWITLESFAKADAPVFPAMSIRILGSNIDIDDVQITPVVPAQK